MDHHPSAINPQIIGAFSVDKDRNYANNLNNLGYVKIPNVNNPIDLRNGEYEAKASYDHYERLHQITGFLKDRKNEAEFMRNGQIKANFVSSGGVLKTIMSVKYDVNSSWVLDAFKFGDTIYLCMNSSVDPLTNLPRPPSIDVDDDSSKFSRYGFKFESYVQASEPTGVPPGSTKKVIEAEEFIVVNKAEIGGFNLIYSCEIDGVKSNEKITNFNQLKGKELVEIKLKGEAAFNKMKGPGYYAKYSMIPWWSSAYLAGIKQFVVGLRGNVAVNDLVTSIHQESTESLSSTIAGMKSESVEYLKEQLALLNNKVFNELNGKSPASFCRFKCTKRFNKNVISFVATHEMNDDMKKIVFVKNLKEIYNVNL